MLIFGILSSSLNLDLEKGWRNYMELWICFSYIEENGQDAIITFPWPTLDRLICDHQFRILQPTCCTVFVCINDFNAQSSEYFTANRECSQFWSLTWTSVGSSTVSCSHVYFTSWCRGKRSKQCKHWCIADSEEPRSERRQSWWNWYELM